MKKLYLDCGMGAAGDMLAAALYELLDDDGKRNFLDKMTAAAPEGTEVSVRPEAKCGILGTHFDVVVNGEVEHSHDHGHSHAHEHSHDHEHTYMHEHCHEHEHIHMHEHDHDHDHMHSHEHCHAHEHTHMHTHSHSHYGMADIEAIVQGFEGISDEVKGNIMDVYKIIAAAESEVHGTDVTEIHFHEVGMMDAVIDVTAVCLLMDMLGPQEITVSPVRVGSGHVRCAHGIIPVPSPAAASILKGIPTYAGGIEAEFCTPTGAALIRYFAGRFGEQPLMQVNRIGYGMGTKDFEVCNCVRALLGE